MSNFDARTNTRWIDLGTRLTLVPIAHPGGPPRPVVPVGIVIETLTDDGKRVMLRVVEATTIGGMTRSFAVERPDGHRLQLEPQRPGEGGGYWQPGQGMTVWVVRSLRAAYPDA